jgi:8-oxo-dGTP pyrophosphatase MutT (NUDIX family)
VHPGESVEEKVSLSDRFGLWLSFYLFDQDQYLAIAEAWVAELGGAWNETARLEALQWATQRGGRSGRTARQFANDWTGRQGLNDDARSTEPSPLAGGGGDRAHCAPSGRTEVAAAVIERPDGTFLMASRPEGKVYAGWWEFPGGKVEPGESARHALDRELSEELGIEVASRLPLDEPGLRLRTRTRHVALFPGYRLAGRAASRTKARAAWPGPTRRTPRWSRSCRPTARSCAVCSCL